MPNYKDEDNKFYYILILTNNSIIFKSKKLIFNKDISINNYSLLNVSIPDFKAENNYYDNIIISNFHEAKINCNQQIYIFKYNNELFNEIIPFIITIKNKFETLSFKFFIVHNLMNNINLFVNYMNKDKCSIEYCYYDFLDKVPFVHSIKVNNKQYSINHYNSFNNTNIIGFILINVPSDENINKIKNNTKREIISAQEWFVAKENKKYYTTQILDVDEAKPKKYLKYNLKLKKYSILENFYFNMFFFYKQWDLSKNEAYKYFEILRKEYELINKSEFDIIKNEYNTAFSPESADFYTYKIYVNLLLFDSLKNIKKDVVMHLGNIYDAWYIFLKHYIKIIEKLNKLSNLLTYHQKMRIIHSYISNIFDFDYPYNYCGKFFYIDETSLNHNNAYLLAFKFNIDIINNLTEKSALTKGFKQLDSFILKNYIIFDESLRNEKNFCLLNEPISLMKYHLLINYEKFLIIDNIELNTNKKLRAYQDISNRVTFINERYLFNCNSKSLQGKDNALPISMENIHENSHEKKNSKNNKEKTPLTNFKNNNIIILKKREDGRFIESLIGSDELVNELKKPSNKLGELMDVNYFIKEDFSELHQKYKTIKKIKKIKTKKTSSNKIIESDPYGSEDKKEDESSEKTDKELKTVEDFEKHYLINNEFIYPDSVPYHEYSLGEKFEISPAEKEYLEKYKDCMEPKRKEASIFKRKISY